MSTATVEYAESAAVPVPDRWRAWIWPTVTTLVLGAAYGPLLAKFFIGLWAKPHYQYFPFVIAAFLWLLWRNVSTAQPRKVEGLRSRFGPLLLLAGAWLLLALAFIASSPWLAIVSAIVLVASRLLKFSADWKVNYLWGIWGVLWLIVPLPLNRDQELIVALQRLSSRLSSTFLDVVAVDHLMDGNTLVLPTKQLFVDEACSGIVSVLSVIACAVIYGVWRSRSPVHVVAALAVAGVGWATLMNVIRITTIALLLDQIGIDWSSGTSHEILSLVIFTFILLGLISTDMLLTALLQPIGATWEQFVAAQAHFGQSVIRWWDRLIANREEVANTTIAQTSPKPTTCISISQMTLRLVPLVAFALLAGLQFTLHFNTNVASAGSPEDPQVVQRAWDCNAETLPTAIGTLRREKFIVETREQDNVMGNYSRIYEYRGESGIQYLASCDFPYLGGWHELTVCYRGLGWQLNDRSIETNDRDVDSAVWQHMEANLSKPDGAYGFLLASAFDNSGRCLDLPKNSIVEDALSVLTNRNKVKHDGVIFQVQVWTTSGRPITQAERDEARRLFFAARQQFFTKVAGLETPVAAIAPQ